jgi:hypothetical protein
MGELKITECSWCYKSKWKWTYTITMLLLVANIGVFILVKEPQTLAVWILVQILLTLQYFSIIIGTLSAHLETRTNDDRFELKPKLIHTVFSIIVLIILLATICFQCRCNSFGGVYLTHYTFWLCVIVWSINTIMVVGSTTCASNNSLDEFKRFLILLALPFTQYIYWMYWCGVASTIYDTTDSTHKSNSLVITTFIKEVMLYHSVKGSECTETIEPFLDFSFHTLIPLLVLIQFAHAESFVISYKNNVKILLCAFLIDLCLTILYANVYIRRIQSICVGDELCSIYPEIDDILRSQKNQIVFVLMSVFYVCITFVVYKYLYTCTQNHELIERPAVKIIILTLPLLLMIASSPVALLSLQV